MVKTPVLNFVWRKKMFLELQLGKYPKNRHYDLYICELLFWYYFDIFFSRAIMDIYLQNSQDPQNRHGFHCQSNSCHFGHLYYSRMGSLHIESAPCPQRLWNCLWNPCIEYFENNLLFHSLHLENGHFPFEFLCDCPQVLSCKSLHPNQVL